MELRQLRHFVELAKALSFRRAAEACRIAQPALSVSLRKLETEIGARLFDRGTREVSLTEAGRKALPAALAALDAARETAHLARSVVKGESGRLTIGIVASATYRLLPSVLPSFRKHHPNVELLFVESTTQKIIGDVLARNFDLGIVRSPVSFACPCDLLQVEADELVAIVPPSHRLASRGNIDLKELDGEPFVIYSSSQAPALHAVVTLACQRAGFVPRVAQEAIQLQTIASFVRSGLGVGLIPSTSMDWIGDRLRACRIRNANGSTAVGLSVVTEPKRQTNLVEQFVSFLSKK
jgi:DNA-binding transcriptional LysR family regulator